MIDMNSLKGGAIMVKTINKLIEGKKVLDLSEYFQEQNPVDISKAIEQLKYQDALLVFRVLSKDVAAEVFSYLDKNIKQIIVQSITDKELKELIEKLFLDDIRNEENTEDLKNMVTMNSNEESYLKTPVIELAKHRVIWLLVLMISATITGSIIKKFDDVLQSVVILAAFIPMLMDTGGNAGSQSSTLVIRGLALGDIKIKDYLKVIWKEFRVSLLVALVLTIVNFIRIYLIEKTDIRISITVCGSLFFTVIIAKVVGSLLPIIAKKLKLDPAIMASPLITTIVDAFALMIYFTFAKLLLGI